MGGRQTFEDITLDRHHPLGTAAKTIADARPGSICSADGQGSNKDPAGATTTQTGTSCKVRSSVGDYRRGACVGRVVCRGWHGHWLGNLTAGVAGTVWTVCGPVVGGVLLAREQRDGYPDRRVDPRLYP